MATAKITNHIRKLDPPDLDPSVLLSGDGRCYLVVIENGNPRRMRISQIVAEVLISSGFSYGN